MKAFFMTLGLTCALVSDVSAQTIDASARLDAPPPKAARTLVQRAADLAGGDRVGEAILTIRKAIASAPDYLDAQVEYIHLRADFLGQVDDVKAEYLALIAREPTNPVYPMALAIGVGGKGEMGWLRRAAELAPDWSWAHFANSFVLLGRTWETMNEQFDGRGPDMLAEALKAIEHNGAVARFYERAIHLQEALGRIDDAIETARKMASRSDLHVNGLRQSWRLALIKARGAQQAKDAIKADLIAVSKNARDVTLLAAVRDACLTLLQDQASAEAVERQILRLDPSWYPERGHGVSLTVTNISGLPYAILAINRRCAIYQRAKQVVLERLADPRQETRRLEALLSMHPNAALERWIGQLLFGTARKAGDLDAMVRYAERLGALDATESAPFAAIALAMADRKADLPKALAYARRAEAALARFHMLPRPAGIPADEFAARFSAEEQENNYRRQRALALDAVGWVSLQMGRAADAEPALRQSVESSATDSARSHLAEALSRLGRGDEADRIVRENDARLLDEVKSQFANRPAMDFDLASTQGRRCRLSDLKGKVVLLNFWATWCGPCVAEMPLFVSTYEKYRSQGFEILAVSADDVADRDKVKRFAEDHGLAFPVLYDEGIARRYGVSGYPTSVFIDRQGTIRYVQAGTFDAAGRRLEIVLRELLK